MAHNLSITDGRTAMMFYGEKPWHGLGVELDHPATAAEAIEAAGLHYQVELAPMFTQDGNQVPRRQAVVRTDSKQVLGTVGPGYTPIQNADCFSFLDAVVADGGLLYHTAGALGHGERIWMLAKLPGHIRVKNSEDITDKFLLLHNSHDGSSSLRVHFTPIRVVCQNTLAIAERNARGQGISIMHKGNLEAKVQEAQKVLGLATSFYDDIQVKIDHLASCYPTHDQLQQFFCTLYPDPDRRKEQTGARTSVPNYSAFSTTASARTSLESVTQHGRPSMPSPSTWIIVVPAVARTNWSEPASVFNRCGLVLGTG